MEYKKIIDFHSHVLPGIDDGSRNVETSIQMLSDCRANGVEVMVATPHFYADCDRVEDFLQKREASCAKLMDACTAEIPLLLLGAEVAFFEGMSRADKISELTIENSDIMLLEMPFRRWRESDIVEVEKLIRERNFQIVIAHLERYLKIQEDARQLESLLELPVMIQINAEALLDWKKRRAALKLFRNGQAQLLGSDCHGLHRRPPNLWEGRAVLEKKLGTAFLDRLDDAGNNLLGKLV